MEEGGDCVCCGEAGYRSTLVGVDEAYCFGDGCKAEGDNLLEDLGEGLEEDEQEANLHTSIL